MKRCDGLSGTISCLEDLQKCLSDVAPADKPRPHERFLFRGQGCAEWQLLPGVYRAKFGKVSGEGERLNRERHLMKDFRAYSAGLRTGRETNAELYFLQQHYGIPTRLLDWTNNPLAALFFAVTDCAKSSGMFFAMDAELMRKADKTKRSYGEMDFIGIATSTHPTFSHAIKRITEWNDNVVFPDFVVPVRPDYFDHRISLQRSCFTFHVTCDPLTQDENETLSSFIIPETEKVKIKAELAQLGIDAFSIYGDLAHLGVTLTDVYCL